MEFSGAGGGGGGSSDVVGSSSAGWRLRARGPQRMFAANVDAATCPPPPSDRVSDDSDLMRWRRRYRGVYERARTMPSKRRAVVVLLLGVVIAVLPWVCVRLYVLRAGARVAINCLC